MKLRISAISFLLATVGASAADLAPQPVEPVAPVVTAYSWTGFYVGAQAGYAWGDSTYSVPVNGFHVSLDPKGFFGGAYAGYNYEFSSRLVVGLEADANFGDVSSSGRLGTTAKGVLVTGEHYDSKLDWFGSVRGRIGYDMDRFLPYITGGIAFGDYEHTAHSRRSTVSWSDTYTGWTAGAGLEYAITNNISARVEYRYTDYGKQSFDRLNGWRPHNVDLKTNDVRVGIGYKF